MKLFKHKLNAQGISHIIVPLIAVVLVGVIGTYLLVGAHAATPAYPCNKNKVIYSYTSYSASHSVTCVVYAQAILYYYTNAVKTSSYYHYYPRLPLIREDGKFGPQTKGQVENLQRWFPTYAKGVDGEIGPNTWTALCHVANGGASEGGLPPAMMKTVYTQAC